MKKTWKHRVKIAILVIISCFIMGFLSFYIAISAKATKILGSNYCNYCEYKTSTSFMEPTTWNCKICGKKGSSSSLSTPKICERCAALTGRCKQCGGLR